ncbi:ABC transporter substrate-binding protein [Catenovulum sediminis]|uniref:ABC transporter substrate-binding protein n=1 Tax=Catenovulum sediminis TaxID=1740262 RepID=UPI00117F7D59|nr:ABC transporter substrate-binding protein [Catenovulum sediminis]
MKTLQIAFFSIFSAFFQSAVSAQSASRALSKVETVTIFTHMGSESSTDTRNLYDKKILKLALDKTVDEYGPYRMVASEKGLTLQRLMKLAETGFYHNFFFKFSATDEMTKRFLAIQIPVDRGIVGFRVAFVHADSKNKYANVRTTEDLQKYSIIQGIGWLDSDILKENELSVFKVSGYDNMFEMISRKRADLFFRGINEVEEELHNFQQQHPNLIVEPNILLQYPLPRFFMTAKSNTEQAKRVELGLKRAFADGSFVELWKTYYLPSIETAQLSGRRIIQLENPYIKNLDSGYTQYNFSVSELLRE